MHRRRFSLARARQVFPMSIVPELAPFVKPNQHAYGSRYLFTGSYVCGYNSPLNKTRCFVSKMPLPLSYARLHTYQIIRKRWLTGESNAGESSPIIRPILADFPCVLASSDLPVTNVQPLHTSELTTCDCFCLTDIAKLTNFHKAKKGENAESH